MKHLKQYENFFTNLFNTRRHSDGIYYWTNLEETELEDNNLFKDVPYPSTTAPYYYIPEHPDTIIKKLTVTKNSDVTTNEHEDWFYEVKVNLIKNNKKFYKTFDTFNQMINFVKEYIPEIETDTKKYNL